MCLATLTNYVILIHSHRQSYTIRKSYTSIDVITQEKLIKIHVLPVYKHTEKNDEYNNVILYTTSRSTKLGDKAKRRNTKERRNICLRFILNWQLATAKREQYSGKYRQ